MLFVIVGRISVLENTIGRIWNEANSTTAKGSTKNEPKINSILRLTGAGIIRFKQGRFAVCLLVLMVLVFGAGCWHYVYNFNLAIH